MCFISLLWSLVFRAQEREGLQISAEKTEIAFKLKFCHKKERFCRKSLSRAPPIILLFPLFIHRIINL